MAVYFYHLVGGTTIRDHDGEECDSLDAAKKTAKLIAHDIARNKQKPEIGQSVCVTDDSGNEVFRTPLQYSN